MVENNDEGSYSDTIKYNIYIKISIAGIAEKSDIIGAIFGQTEGLLGDSLDLRDLQRTNRIGRITVNNQYNKSQRKTTGTIIVPSSLDRIETGILAASLETVDRVQWILQILGTANQPFENPTKEQLPFNPSTRRAPAQSDSFLIFISLTLLGLHDRSPTPSFQ